MPGRKVRKLTLGFVRVHFERVEDFLPADKKERQQFPMEVRNIAPGSLILAAVLLMENKLFLVLIY